MYRLIHRIAFLIVLAGSATSQLHAAIVTYDASSGLLPQDVGWTYTDEMTPASSAVVSGGILTFDTPLTNRA